MENTPDNQQKQESQLNQQQSESNSSAGTAVKLLLAIVIVAALAFFLMRGSGGDELLARKLLDDFAERLSATAESQGFGAKFIYGDVEVERGDELFQITIIDSRLTLSEKGSAPVTLSTKELIITPKSLPVEEYSIKFTKPLLVRYHGSGEEVKISFGGEPEFRVSKEQENNIMLLNLPSSFTVTSDAPAEEPVTVSYDDGAVVYVKTDNAYNWREYIARMDNLKVVVAEENVITVKTVDSRATNTPLDDGSGQHDLAGKISLDDLVVPINPYGAVDALFDTNLRVDPSIFEQPEKLNRMQPFEFTIKNISIGTPQFGISLNGNIVGVRTDPDPYGRVEFAIRRFDLLIRELEKFGIIDEQTKAQLEAALGAALGKEKDISKITDLQLSVYREQGSDLHFGKASLDEVISAVAVQSMVSPPVDSNSDADSVNNTRR